MMKLSRQVNFVLGKFGYRVSKVGLRPRKALRGAENVATLIDVGCAYGTPEFYAANKRAGLFLIDPVREYEPHMLRLLRRRPGGHEIVAAGGACGEVTVDVEIDNPTKTSLLPRTALTSTPGRRVSRTVPLKTLDAIVEDHALEPPFGIKIDTEGYELEVVRGARKTLSRTDFVIAETSVQRRFADSYTFLDLLKALDGFGFEVANVLTANPDRHGLVRYVDLLYTKRGACGTGAVARAGANARVDRLKRRVELPASLAAMAASFPPM